MSKVAIRLPVPSTSPVTQRFGENPDVYKRFGKPGHNGVDFGISEGTPVMAAGSGKITKVGWEEDGYGNYVIIEHDGYSTLYAHLSRVTVAQGQTVSAGEVIGLSGKTGFSTGAHLHFELRIPGFSGSYNKGEVDPLQFVLSETSSSNGTKEYYTVRASALNVRLEPRLGSRVIGQLPTGSRIKVEGFEGDWAWFKVYVSKEWIE